jgi:sugar O-acyltransferase (sialic acid O-acetyltransferase NeuD family)
MQKGIVILGSGAQGKITADLCRDMGINLLGYLDDTKEIGTVVNNLQVLGKFSLAWEGGLGNGVSYTVALGDPFMRTLFFETILRSGGKAASIIHPKSFISPSAFIGEGTLISPFCCIWAGARIGRFCLLEVGCHVGVDNDLGEGVFLGPSCLLNASCTIGEKSFLGTGTVVIPRKNIGAGVVIGAGSTVIADIPPNKVAVGSPARVVKDRS